MLLLGFSINGFKTFVEEPIHRTVSKYGIHIKRPQIDGLEKKFSQKLMAIMEPIVPMLTAPLEYVTFFVQAYNDELTGFRIDRRNLNCDNSLPKQYRPITKIYIYIILHD